MKEGVKVSLVGKNMAIFITNNVDRNNSNFMYKDLEKQGHINSSFINAKFTGTLFRAAHMKYCNFSNCIFHGVDFVITNLHESIFSGAYFKEYIFVVSVL